MVPENSKLVIPTPYMEFTEYSGFAREWAEGDCLVNSMPLGRWSAPEENHLKLKKYFKDVGEAIGVLHFETYQPNRNDAWEPAKRYISNL
jgi:hypothetical protein